MKPIKLNSERNFFKIKANKLKVKKEAYFKGIKESILAYKSWRTFCKIPQDQRKIVFYAESTADLTHFELIIDDLTREYGQTIYYLTSDLNDAIFKRKLTNVHPFYIGSGFICTFAFRLMRAKVMVITLLDLDRFYLKRSVHPINYFYVFHSLTSTHVAFNHLAHHGYDTVLCAGPHHLNEIREVEKTYNLRPKKLIECGYGRLDKIILEKDVKAIKADSERKSILIAPSWGESSISHQCLLPLTKALLENGFKVIYRPHPMTCWHNNSIIKQAIDSFSSHEQFILDNDFNSEHSFYQSDIMISDWSGAALEFSFGLLRPVIFIETGRKINNPRHQDIKLEPIEVFIRDQIGKVVPISEVSQIHEVVKDLLEHHNEYRDQIIKSREQWVYNVGHSAKVASKAIFQMANDRAGA